jgi:Flp pilus assembly protein TadG
MMAMAMKLIASQLRNHIRNFAAARHGSIAVIFGLAAIPIMTAVGAAVDFSRGGATKAAMQGAADSAALQLVQDAGTLPEADLTSKATALFTAMFNSPEAQNVAVTAQFDPAAGILTVTGSAGVPTTFMGMVGIETMEVAVVAKAREASRPACVIALDASANAAFKVAGQGTVNIPNCGMHVNSSHTNALTNSGTGWIKAKSITVVGGFTTGNYTPTPQKKPVVADPLSSIAEPTVPGSCTYTKKDFDTATTFPGGTVYCGKITFNASATFGPGIHYFKDAQVSTASNITLTADKAMLHFSANSEWDSSGAGKIIFSPMESGTYAGIAIFGSRSDTKAPAFKLTGNKDYFVSGTVYLPKQDLQLAGGADLSVTSKSGYVITLRFSYSGNSNFTFDAYGGSGNTAFTSFGSTLVQ